MEDFRDPRQRFLNAWAKEWVREHRGEPFPAAATEFWESLTAWIRDLARWRAKNDPSVDPDDLAGLVLKTIVAHSDRYRGDGEFGAWVYTICRNLFRTMRRANLDMSQLDGDSAAMMKRALDAHGRGRFVLCAAERKRLVAEQIARISNPKHAKIFELAKLRGFTDEELALEFGMKPASIRSIVKRVMDSLRSFSQPGEGGLPPRKPGSAERGQAATRRTK